MGETTRTFFAIEVPEQLRRELERLQTGLAPDIPGCRWASSGSFHMTLAFLGEVRNGDLTRLEERVASRALQFEPIDLCFEGLGAFPSPRRPSVLWAGLIARTPALLSDIRKSVVAAASESGYPCEDERFSPHVTLGRFKPGRRGTLDLTAIMERYRTWSCGNFTASEVVGFASRLGQAGPTYEALSRAPLGGEKSQPST
jgi:RNA 2',3'-cyclic 3'-phosphodiesterase